MKLSHNVWYQPKSSNFDHSFIKLGHNDKYPNVFLEFDNGPDCNIPSGVIALCLWDYVFFCCCNVQSLNLSNFKSDLGPNTLKSIQIHYSYFDLSMITITLQLQDL